MSEISQKPDQETPAKNQPDNIPSPLPGEPGYRNRTGRSGLDYVDTQKETGHMAGMFLRKLITNVYYLAFLIAGLLLWFAFPGTLQGLLGIVMIVVVVIVAAVRFRRPG